MKVPSFEGIRCYTSDGYVILVWKYIKNKRNRKFDVISGEE